jgi:hypothetical protein
MIPSKKLKRISSTVLLQVRIQLLSVGYGNDSSKKNLPGYDIICQAESG